MSGTEITYRLRSDTRPEMELSILANVYKFALDCRTKKGAATSPVSRPEDAERSPSDSASNHSTA